MYGVSGVHTEGLLVCMEMMFNTFGYAAEGVCLEWIGERRRVPMALALRSKILWLVMKERGVVSWVSICVVVIIDAVVSSGGIGGAQVQAKK